MSELQLGKPTSDYADLLQAIAERDAAIEKAFAERERQTGMLAWAQEAIRERDERIDFHAKMVVQLNALLTARDERIVRLVAALREGIELHTGDVEQRFRWRITTRALLAETDDD